MAVFFLTPGGRPESRGSQIGLPQREHVPALEVEVPHRAAPGVEGTGPGMGGGRTGCAPPGS